MTDAEFYQDPYRYLAAPQPLFERCHHLYRVLREQYAWIERFSLALYDEENGQLSTFSCLGDEASPLAGYSVHLDETPSLKALAQDQSVRVVNDMRHFRNIDPSPHSLALLGSGYRSSFTMPLRYNGRFFGFLFLNSRKTDYFSESMVVYCTLWSHLIGHLLVRERETIERLQALACWALDVTGAHSSESDEHMRRMAAYATLIARKLQGKHRLTDDWISYLTLFAPLHDIGKVSMPSRLLHKPGELTADEFDQMKQHVLTGRTLVDRAIEEFQLDQLEHVEMIRNIVQYHHEKLDGSGYLGLSGVAAIPLEARIIAVSDIVDALLNDRCYKQRWNWEAVKAELQQQSGTKLDADCVAAILDSEQEVLEIRDRWHGDEAA